MHRKINRFIVFILLLSLNKKIATADKQEGETANQIKIGNLAHDISQQPAPLFSIGQNTVAKKDFLYEAYFSKSKGKTFNFLDLTNTLYYGVNDNLTISFSIPWAISFKEKCAKSSGLADVFFAAEYAYYNKESVDSTDQATILANVFFPTGSTRKNPSVGAGTTTYLLGGTASHVGIKWYYFGSGGALLVPANHGTKFSSQILYEAGIGHNIGNARNLIWLLLLEFNGIWSVGGELKKAPIVNPSTTNPNALVGGSLFTRGNVIFFGPSLFISSARLILHSGIQFPILQKIENKALKNDYRVAIRFVYKF